MNASVAAQWHVVETSRHKTQFCKSIRKKNCLEKKTALIVPNDIKEPRSKELIRVTCTSATDISSNYF